MHGSDNGFRRWLNRWFGVGGSANDNPDVSGDRSVGTNEESGPLFSLGDTKQDVVVSFRATQADES